MDSNPISEKFLACFGCADINDGLLEDNIWDMINCFMQSEGSPILKINALKDMGNYLFKEKCYEGAANCYDEACKLLSLTVGMKGSYEISSLSDLMVSLSLNLVACALKLLEYEATKDLCSIVLSSFPHNVKALFRRGLAFMKLNRLLYAQLGFEEALLVEPKNKDILRELSVVKSCLIINSNGKRNINDHSMQDTSRMGMFKMKGLIEVL
ncbi:70 kDa peptidyl-prolyl isomerase-like [Silene latifolia]|uniref:70 kDa peptidyl-prolyl isomerase-like n=1 Tax=Silene latifolia TaxID=37657 RepID=UPI003D77AE37